MQANFKNSDYFELKLLLHCDIQYSYTTYNTLITNTTASVLLLSLTLVAHFQAASFVLHSANGTKEKDNRGQALQPVHPTTTFEGGSVAFFDS